jgi:PAS domain S-box-containing protein
MNDIYKSKEQLVRELDDMQHKLNELETCEVEFKRIQRRYKELLRAAPDAMIFISSDNAIVMINAQTERLFGYTADELTGKTLDVLIPERFRHRHKKNVTDFFSSPRVRTMGSGTKIFGLRKDGSEFRADISLSPLQTYEGLLVTAAVRDITEYVDIQEQLAQNEKLAALGRISANVAHELRNPLTSIGGFARRLLSVLKDGTIEKEYAGSIVAEVLGLEQTLKDVLDYSRMAVPHLERHNLHAIIDEVLDNYREVCKEHDITIKTTFSDSPDIMLDKEQTNQAIGNLITNAVEAMPHGGELFVSTSIKSVESQQYVVVEIRDTSAGMLPEVIGKIFEPFFTTKISKRGVGLGLPIAKKIMEDHGGFILVNSTPQRGSAFSLYFPLSVNRKLDKGYMY